MFVFVMLTICTFRTKAEFTAIAHFYTKMIEVCPRIELALDTALEGDTTLLEELSKFVCFIPLHNTF